MSQLNLTPDALLSTTRSVRKRLDFSRAVEAEVIRECAELAVQAPILCCINRGKEDKPGQKRGGE